VSAEIGFIDPVRKDALHRQASLIVLPYTEMHSQSGVLADAYAYRIPIVATDVGAVGDTVRDDGTGWVVPPSDPPALADALRSAVKDTSALRAVASAIDRVAEEYSYEKVGARMREIYERTIIMAGR